MRIELFSTAEKSAVRHPLGPSRRSDAKTILAGGIACCMAHAAEL